MMILQDRMCVIKQILATAVSGFLSLCGGIAFGFSAVLLPQLKTDEDFPYDERYMSWIAAMAPLSMGFGGIFAGSMIDKLGRKPGHVILAISFTVSWVVQAFAFNNPMMLLGRFMTGLCSGAIRPIALVYLGEIADPKYRGVILFTPSLTLSTGVVLTHTLGGYVDWMTNSLICTAPSVIALILSLFLKESPLWLISNEKIAEGVEMFRWFRGESEAAENELKSILLEEQNEKRSAISLKAYFKRDFLKPLAFTFLLSVVTHISGANVLSFYAQDILGLLIPNDITPFTLMVITDCVRLIATLLIFFMVNRFPRKLSLMFCCFGASFMIYCLMGFLYLDVSHVKWFTIVLLIAYMLLASAIVTYAWSIVAELYSSKFRGVGSGASSALSYFTLFVIVKITPGLISAVGVTALYLGFATVTIANAAILCYLLPETNGRSLQDIEDELKEKNKVTVSKL